MRFMVFTRWHFPDWKQEPDPWWDGERGLTAGFVMDREDAEELVAHWQRKIRERRAHKHYEGMTHVCVMPFGFDFASFCPKAKQRAELEDFEAMRLQVKADDSKRDSKRNTGFPVDVNEGLNTRAAMQVQGSMTGRLPQRTRMDPDRE